MLFCPTDWVDGRESRDHRKLDFTPWPGCDLKRRNDLSAEDVVFELNLAKCSVKKIGEILFNN